MKKTFFLVLVLILVACSQIKSDISSELKELSPKKYAQFFVNTTIDVSCELDFDCVMDSINCCSEIGADWSCINQERSNVDCPIGAEFTCPREEIPKPQVACKCLNSACFPQTLTGIQDEETIAQIKCINLCLTQQKADLTKGPCLSDEIIPNWVCDVAHSPKLPVDLLKENQCPAFSKTAGHFVEVDEKCELIKIF